MLIVDAQIHLWSKNLPTNPAHRQIPSWSAEECLMEMDQAGVNAALIHPPGWDPDSLVVAESASVRYPERYAILGNFPLDKPESRNLIDGWLSRPGMLGLRFAFTQPHQQSWPTDGTLDWLWPEAERAGIPVALAAANFLPVVGRIAERHPGLRLLVDHLGMPLRAKDDAAFANLPQLLALARHPNIAVKATAVPSYSSAPYPFRNIHGHLRRIYDAFGPERLFWGSDITRMPCSWRQCVTLFTEELAFLTPQDKEQIMGRALCRWIGWTRA